MDVSVYVVSSADDPHFYYRRAISSVPSCRGGHPLPHDCDGTIELEMVDGCKPIKWLAYAGLGLITFARSTAASMMAVAPECSWAEASFVRTTRDGPTLDRRFDGHEVVAAVPMVRCVVNPAESDSRRYSTCEVCGHPRARLDRKSILQGGELVYAANSSFVPWFVNSNGTCYTLATDQFVEWWQVHGDQSLAFLEAGVAKIYEPR